MANEELATAIRQVKSGKEFHFALIAKSGNPQLAMDKRKVNGDEIAKMKKVAGGGAVIRGTCVMENGTLILMTSASASDAIGAQLKKLIKEETGLTVNCAFRASAAEGEEEEEENDEEGKKKGKEEEEEKKKKQEEGASPQSPTKPAPAGPAQAAQTPAAPQQPPATPQQPQSASGPAQISKRPLMVEFADLVKANAAKIKDQPEVAKLVRAIKTALDADKLTDAETLIAALKRQLG